MVCNHLKLRYARFFFNLRIRNFLRVRLLWQMNSHNSAISSRTDLNPVVSSQSLYIATVVGRLCCTHLLIHYNASQPNPCIIVLGRPEVLLFLRASSFLPFASRDSPVLLHRNSLLYQRCYVLPMRNFMRLCLPVTTI